jgi:DNA modification methylase
MRTSLAPEVIGRCHPTVKPVAMIAAAILDCSARGDIVLEDIAGRQIWRTGIHPKQLGPRELAL